MVEGFDVGLEMSGSPSAFRQMLEVDEPRRQASRCSASRPPTSRIDWNQVIFKGLIIKGIYGREMFETWYKMIAMLQSGLDIRPVITHHCPLPVPEGLRHHALGQVRQGHPRLDRLSPSGLQHR